MTSADRQAIRQMLRFQLQWDSEWSCRSEAEQWNEVDRIEKNDQLEWIAAWGGVKSARNRVEARRAAAGRMAENRPMPREVHYSDAGQRLTASSPALAGSVQAAVACVD